MEGEDEESNDPRAFGNKKPWRRFIIVAAGATFNLILGFVIAVLMTIPQERYATTTIGKFEDGAVSCNYGLQVNDEIVAANGRKIYCFSDLSYMLASAKDGKLDFTVLRDGKKVELKNVTFNLEPLDDGNNYISLDFRVYGEEKTFTNTLKYAAKTTVSYGRIVYMSLYDMITGKFKINQMSGPVGITAAVSQATRQSVWNILYYACIITVNLGIMNLLPLPALDGGRLLFILIEMIRRKPIPAKYEGLVHTIGFVILFGLIILITFNDILNLIR
jgi:regulator of sigma E protease